MGGADGRAGVTPATETLGERGGMTPEGGLEIFAIGFVTAVDHAGFAGGVDKLLGGGVERAAGLIGKVVAAEILGRGVIFVEAGLRGRGGRLIRNVSRFGAFGSEPSLDGGVAESAIIESFYSYFRKYSMVKFAIVTCFLNYHTLALD